MLQEFKDFINRGPVLELAVAVVIGIAFGLVVKALIDYVILPIVGLPFGEPGFATLNFTVNDVTIGIGSFIDEVVNFVLLGFGVFVFVKMANKVMKPKEEAAGPSEVELLTEIRDSLRQR